MKSIEWSLKKKTKTLSKGNKFLSNRKKPTEDP